MRAVHAHAMPVASEEDADATVAVARVLRREFAHALHDSKNRDVVLGRLVQHFAKLQLSNANLSEPDMLGRAYEYLIEKFADDAGKKGGEFYTPRMVVRLIVELL